MKKGIDKLGIVLAGGGGRGGYQIGVLKYLKEANLTRNIKAIAGTSVGALNACLYALDDYELAEKIWLNEIQDSILSPGTDNIIKVFEEKAPQVLTPKLLYTLEFISHCGIFSRDGLVRIIEKYIDLDYIQNCDIPIYANTTKQESLLSLVFSRENKAFKLNGESREKIIQILLATSAIPFIFPTQIIDDVVYCDGCLSDNIPIKPLIEKEKCTDIIVVHLERDKLLKNRKDEVRIYEICPQNNLGDVFDGVLDFSPQGAKRRIEQGYMDAKAIIGPAVDMAKTQAKIIVDLENMIDSERRYREKLKELKKKKDN